MAVAFDPAKDMENRRKHGLSLSAFVGFDDEPIVLADDRRDYGERRYRALGRIEGRAHVIVYAVRGDELRLISFRRAHEKEVRRYERQRQS